MRRKLLLSLILFIALICSGSLYAQTPIHTINFAVDGAGYTTTNGFRNNDNQYWQRFDKDDEGTGGGDDHDFNSALSGVTGDDFYFAGEDMDFVGEGAITSTSINVTAFNNLEIVLKLAAPGTGYEPGADYIIIEYTYDGSTYTRLSSFTGAASGGAFGEDVNNDGVADGTTLTAALQTFTYAIPKLSTTLHVRIRASNTASSEEFVIDNIVVQGITDATAPTITSINRADSNPTNADDVNFTVTFSEAVTGVGTDDFTKTGTATGTISGISGSGTTYTVTVNSVSGDGTLGLDAKTFAGGATIDDIAGNDFTAGFTGAIYTIDNTVPTAAITYDDADGFVKAGQVLRITATFTEAVKDAPIMQVSLSGTNTLALANMTKSSSTVYYYDHTVGAGNGTVTVAMGTGTDLAGNAITVAPTSGVTFTVDNTPPTAAITYDDADGFVTTTQVVRITATFTEPVHDAPIMQISLSGANVLGLTNMTKVSSTEYYYDHTVGAGEGTITVALGTGTDPADNVVTATPTSGATFTTDNLSPTAAITYDDADGFVKAGQVLRITATFNEAVKDAPVMQVSLSGANALALTDMIKSSSTVYYYDHTVGSGDGAVTVTLGTGTDLAGYAVTATPTSGPTFTVDNTIPTVVLSDDQTDALVRDANTVLITATFTDASNLLGGAPAISIGSVVTSAAMTATANPLVWTYTWNVPSGNNGAASVSIVAADAAGNASAAATGVTSYTIDNTAPTVVITDDHPDSFVTNADVVNITATFTEANDLDGTPTITIGTLVTNAAMTGTADPLVWTYAWSVTTGDETASVSITAPDVAGNPCAAPTGQTSYTVDNTAPAVVLSDNHPDAIVRDADNIIITATFTEANTPLATPDITIGTIITGVAMTATADPLVWTYTWNVPSGNDGAVSVSVSTTDVVGQANTAATGQTSYTIDNTAPTVVLSDDQTDALVRDANTVLITATFTDANLLGGTPSITIGSVVTSVAMTATANPLVWTYTWNVPSGNDGAASVSISATDAAGNANAAATGVTSYTIDNTAPAVVMTDDHPDSFVKNGDVVNITATFTEINGITGTPAITIGSIVTGVAMTATADPLVWTYAWSVGSGNTGVAVSVTGVTDVAGNSNAAATGQTSYTIDNTDPTVVLTDDHADALVRDADNVIITATFTDVNGIAPTPTISIGSVVTNASMTATANPLIWTYTWNVPSGNDGLVNVSISALDVAGNSNAAATGQTSYTIDNTGPSVVLSHDHADGIVRDADNVNITATFTEINSLGGTPSITIGSVVTAVAMSATADPLVWTYSWNVPSGNDGNASVSITVTDVAGNGVSSTSGQTSYIIDNTGPSVTLQDNHPDNIVRDADNVTIQATFTEANGLNGTPTISIGSVVTNASMTGTANPLIWTYGWNVPAGNDGSQAVSISVTDVAGNANSAAVATTGQTTYIIDNTAPTVSAVIRLDPALNNTSTGRFQVVFEDGTTDAVTSISAADFQAFGTASGGTSINFAATADPAVYNVDIENITGAGNLGLRVLSANVITDIAGNPLAAPFDGPDEYDVIFPEPARHVTNFQIDATGTTFTQLRLTWTDVIGSPAPAQYLIVVKRGSSTPSHPVDGTPVADQLDLITPGNTVGYLNVPHVGGANTATFSSLLSGETYTFWIYPYTNGLSDIDYKIDADVNTPQPLPTTSASTPVAATASIGQGLFSPTTILSTATTSGAAVLNARFYIWDGGSATADNAPVKVSKIVLQRNTAPGMDQIGDWTNAIASAELTVENSDGSFGATKATVDITADKITFDNLYDEPTSEFFGRIPDDDYKFFLLKIILKPTLGGTLPADIDNLHFTINALNAAANMPLASGSTQFVNTAQVIVSPHATVSVVATQLDFSTSPNTNQLVQIDVTSTSAAPDASTVPVVRARDLNGNTDRDFDAATITLQNTGLISMSAVSVSMTDGKATFPSTFQYLDAGNGRLTASTTTLATNGLAPSSGISGPVTVAYSNLTTIIPSSSGLTPISTASIYAIPFSFTITDDGGPGNGDGAPTRITQIKITKKASANPIPDWQEILDIGNANGSNLGPAVLYDGTNSYKNLTVTVNPDEIIFSDMLSTANDANVSGLIGDGQPKTFQLYILLKPTFGGTLPSTVDFMNFDFEVDPVNVQFSPQSSGISASQTPINSGPIDVDVVATKLRFEPTANPAPSILTNKNISLQPPVPQVEAVDARGNRDKDFSSTTVTVTNAATTPPSALPMLNVPGNTSITNGLLTFPNNFQFTSTGDDVTLTVAAIGTETVTDAVSSLFDVRVGISGTITAGAAVPATISSLDDTDPEKIKVFEFVINDEPSSTPPLEDDGNDILVEEIVITRQAAPHNTIANWSQAIAVAILSDGANTQVGTVGTDKITFTGIPTGTLGNVPDDGSKTYQLFIYLRPALLGTLPESIDGLKFGFKVNASDIKTLASGTSIISTESEDPAAGTEVIVVATKLEFIASAGASINVPFPVIVEASDANGNRDKNFTGADTEITAFGTVVTTNTDVPQLNNAAHIFTSGVYTFPANFQYTAENGTNNDGQLTMSAGKNSFSTISGTSDPIDITSASESVLTFNPGFVPTPLIPYVSRQDDSNMEPLAGYLLTDGNGVTPDTDGAATSIQSITFAVKTNNTPGSSDIRNLALFNSAGNLIVSLPLSGGSIAFSGLTGITTGTDGAFTTFTLRASFKDTPANVHDHDQIQVSITNITMNGGSQLNPTGSVTGANVNPGTGAVTAAPFTATTVNIVDAVATQLDFTTQPGPLAGINQPITEPVIEARDIHQVVDLDIHGVFPVISSTATNNAATLTPLPQFQNGVLSFAAAGLDLQYTSAGIGTLTVSGVTNAASNAVTNAVSNTVNVRHLQATKVNDVNNSKGIAVETEMLSGRQSAILLGITFNAPHIVPTGPVLNSFTVNFSDDDPLTSNPDGVGPNPDMNQIFENIRVWQSTNDDAWTASDQNVTANFTTTVSGDNIKFDLISDRNFAAAGTTVTYFIMVDIKTSVNISTPRIRPNLRRLSYTGGTEGNIILGTGVLTDGSSFANIEGRTYLFTDKAPPKIVNGGRTPANGALNHPVIGAGSNISITFDEPVFSLTNQITVFRFDTPGDPGIVLSLHASVTEPTTTLIFPTLGLLASDQRYYIDLDGIVDTSTPANAFGGFTTTPLYFTPDNTNWVFKTADTDGPKIVGNTVLFTDITEQGGNLKVVLDEPGTVYYMIVDELDPTITQDQIIDPSTYSGEVIAGSAAIPQADQDNFISISTGLVDGEDYVIYVTAVDPGGNKMGTPTGPLLVFDEFDGDDPTPTHGNLIVSAPANYQICVGDYQPLSYPITITESGNSNFSNGSFNILLPAGFAFFTPSINQDVPGIVSASGSGGITATAQFKAENILQIKLASVSGGNRERITISGLQVKANANATSGPIFRLGGNALSQGDIPDLDAVLTFGSLQRYNVSPIDFTVTVDGAVKTSLPDFKKDANTGDIQSYSAILESEEKEVGTNIFSGDGVVGYTFIPSFAGIGSHVITLKYSNEYNCQSENVLTVKVFDYTRGIDGLTTQYCTDKNVLTNIPIQGKTGYTLRGISVEVNADDNDNRFHPSFDVTQSLEVLDVTFTNVIFKPYVFDTPEHRALFNDGTVLYSEGGRIGSVKVKGTYLNLLTFNDEIFEQVIDIYIPPTATLSFREVGPLSGSPERYCEDQLVNLEGSPRVSPSSEGEFTINGLRGINKDVVNGYAGLTDIGDGTGIVNAKDVASASRFNALTVKYSFEISATGCKNEVESVINFTPKPTADFPIPSALCEDTPISFNGVVDIVRGNSNQFDIQTLSWDFDDLNSGNNNNSDVEDPNHTFDEPGNYDVRFKVVSKDGCVSAPHAAKNLIVGGKPVVNFTFAGTHNEELIDFDASASTVNGNSTISTLQWNFGEGAPYTSTNKDEDIKKDYTNPGVYQVALLVRSAIGCETTLTRTVAVVPYFAPVDGTDYYKEFSANGEGWQPLSLTGDATLNSWTVNGQKWTTGATGSYKPQERSALYTAAINLSGLSRPILSFKNTSALASSDGVVLEYSTDNKNIADPGKIWQTLGTLTKGVVSGANWYNGANLASQPGDQLTGDLGWTGTLPERESKHSLTAAKGQANVVFRFALASALNTQPNLEGFSIDNFRIGNGTRTVLIENFTNTGSTDASVKAENDSLRKFADGNIGVELVKLNYHVGFPGEDPFNLQNQADPGARALYYGISTINQVRLDGVSYGTQVNPKFSQWGPTAFSNRILDLANAKIEVNAEVVGEELVISGTFEPSITMTNPTILHVAIVEERVTVDSNPELNSTGRIRSGESEFEYVVRKMLPNAAGTKYTSALTAGTPISFGPFTWANATLFKPEDDLAVVVFLQDENSKVIYQSYVKRNIEDPGIVTGIEDINTAFNVYPNPADREITIKLPAAADQRAALRMYDQLGNVVEESYFEKGDSKKTVNTGNMAGGVYLIQIESPKGMLRRKVMVVHRN